jgi:Mg-chelatase subunit ChlD
MARPRGSDRLAIRDVDTRDFHQVRLVAQVAGKVPKTAPFTLRENGTEVDEVELTRPAAGRRIVFVVDTSGSMRTDVTPERVNAALDHFIDESSRDQFALVTFSDGVTVVRDFGQPEVPVSGEFRTFFAATRLWDGLDTAARLLSARPEGPQPNIVLITDGRDTGSQVGLADLRQRLARVDAAVFPIGIEGSDLDAVSLEQLARATNGFYRSGAPDDLADMVSEVGATLSQQYSVSYWSTPTSGSLDIEMSWGKLYALEANVAVDTVRRDRPTPPGLDRPADWGPFEHPAARWVIAVLVVGSAALWAYGLGEFLRRSRLAPVEVWT